MRISTALNHRDRAIGMYADTLSWMEISGISSHDVNARSIKVIQSISHCPQWVKSYVEGWWAARRAMAERALVFFYTMPDGVLASTHRDRADYYEKLGMGPKEVYDKATHSGHYWVLKDRDSKERIRPYFVGESRSTGQLEHFPVVQVIENNRVVSSERRD